MSTDPSWPKPADASPVRAFTDIKRLPAVKRIRAGVEASPGQNATPRAVVLILGSLYSHTSLPVSASIANTRLAPGRYMMPLTTSGVASGFTVGTTASPRPPPPLPVWPGESVAWSGPLGTGDGGAPRPPGRLLNW